MTRPLSQLYHKYYPMKQTDEYYQIWQKDIQRYQKNGNDLALYLMTEKR